VFSRVLLAPQTAAGGSNNKQHRFVGAAYPLEVTLLWPRESKRFVEHLPDIHIIQVVIQSKAVSALYVLNDFLPGLNQAAQTAMDYVFGAPSLFKKRANRVHSIPPPELAAEVSFAVVWLEECPDGAIGVEGEKRTALAIEPCHDAVVPDCFDYDVIRLPIAQFLSHQEVLVDRDGAKLAAVFVVMLHEPGPRRKANAGVSASSRRFWTAFIGRSIPGRRRVQLRTRRAKAQRQNAE
jgi:hypothetical protein